MPVNKYVVTDELAGEECSSTYEGRHLTFEESALAHPYHADGFVDGGDPVVIDNIVGVAFTSAAAATDMIAIDTEGTRFLNVLGSVSDDTDDGVAEALPVGTPIYIKKAGGTVGSPYVLSGQSDPAVWQHFGYVLGEVSAHLTTPTLVAVKVHWDPEEYDALVSKEITFEETVSAGVWTGSVNVPAGATLVNIIVHATALWDSETSATMIVGDATDPNGFYAAVNLKATDLLAGEAIDFAHTGGKEGADLDAPAAAVAVRRRYLAAARVISGEITKVGDTGAAGRTRMTVIYSNPETAVVATKA